MDAQSALMSNSQITTA